MILQHVAYWLGTVVKFVAPALLPPVETLKSLWRTLHLDESVAEFLIQWRILWVDGYLCADPAAAEQDVVFFRAPR